MIKKLRKPLDKQLNKCYNKIIKRKEETKMKNELLIEIISSCLNNELCDGCERYGSPYSYENGGSCQKCRNIASKEIKSILEKQKKNN